MPGWTREGIHHAASYVDVREFERRRRSRMQERESRARLYRLSGNNVIPFPARSPAPPKDAA